MANSGGEFNRVNRDGDEMTQGGSGTLNMGNMPLEFNDSGSGDNIYITKTLAGTELKFRDDDVGVELTLRDLWAGAPGAASMISKSFTATPGQVLFDIVPDTYPVGAGVMHVFVSGRHVPAADFTETSDHEITITGADFLPLLGGEIVECIVFAGIPAPGSVFQVMCSGDDTTPNYLENKIEGDGTTVTVTTSHPAGNEHLTISALDQAVKVSGADTTSDNLNAKIAAGTNVTKTILLPAGNEQLEISAVDSKVKVTAADASEDELDSKLNVTAGLTKAAVDIGAGVLELRLSPDVANMPYTPTTPADWDAPAPTTVQDALDRLAAWCVTHDPLATKP